MKEILQKIKGILPIIKGLVALDGYRRTLSNDKVAENFVKATESLQNTNKKLEDLYTAALNKKQDLNLYNAKELASQDRVKELLESFRNSHNKVQELKKAAEDSQTNQALAETIKEEMAKLGDRITSELEDLSLMQSRKSLELEDIINSISNTNNPQFWDNY